MKKEYRILVIDDEQDVVEIFKVLKSELKYEGIDVNFEFIRSMDSETFEINDPYDIIMFDCYLPASNMVKYEEKKDKIGFQLIKKFRKKNYSTKVIFYSSSFNIDDGEAPFTVKEFLTIINDLNVFKMVERNNTEMMMKAIISAIEELDMILISMEDIYNEYGNSNLTYNVGEKQLTLNELINQFKIGGEDAKKFSQQVTTMILHFLCNYKSK